MEINIAVVKERLPELVDLLTAQKDAAQAFNDAIKASKDPCSATAKQLKAIVKAHVAALESQEAEEARALATALDELVA